MSEAKGPEAPVTARDIPLETTAAPKIVPPNVIVVNEDGLDEEALAEVLSPFENKRHFVGIRIAAEAATSGEIDPLLKEELALYARASVVHR